jgi:uncharacterized protein YndB with AHSA1/START domain
MGYATASSIVNVPVEAVWAALNDIDHTPEWVIGLENAEVKTSQPYGAGTVYHDYNRLGPWLQVTEWQITEFEPMSHQVHVSKSAVLPSKMKLNLSPNGEATNLTMTVEYSLLPTWGAISRVLERLFMNRMLTGVLKQNVSQLSIYLNQDAAKQPAYARS